MTICKTIKLYIHNLKLLMKNIFKYIIIIFSMFNLITFEIIQFIEDGLFNSKIFN